jgi:hypothetical protein
MDEADEPGLRQAEDELPPELAAERDATRESFENLLELLERVIDE